MKLTVLFLYIFIVQCRPLPSGSNQPVGLIAVWKLLHDTAINYFTRFNPGRAFGKFKDGSSDGSLDVTSTKPVLHVLASEENSNGWLWCSDRELHKTFAFKPCPGDRQLELCLIVTNASRSDVMQLMAGNWKVSDTLTMKWAFCYLTKTGVMSENGVLRQDVVLENIPQIDKLKVEEVINECLYKQPMDPVKTAWHYLTCFRWKMPEYAKIANRI